MNNDNVTMTESPSALDELLDVPAPDTPETPESKDVDADMELVGKAKRQRPSMQLMLGVVVAVIALVALFVAIVK